MGTGSFPGVKRPGRGVDHPTPYNAEGKEYSYTTTARLSLRGLLEGELYLYLYVYTYVRATRCHLSACFASITMAPLILKLHLYPLKTKQIFRNWLKMEELVLKYT
jgi:hypothetical protein